MPDYSIDVSKFERVYDIYIYIYIDVYRYKSMHMHMHMCEFMDACMYECAYVCNHAHVICVYRIYDESQSHLYA